MTANDSQPRTKTQDLGYLELVGSSSSLHTVLTVGSLGGFARVLYPRAVPSAEARALTITRRQLPKVRPNSEARKSKPFRHLGVEGWDRSQSRYVTRAQRKRASSTLDRRSRGENGLVR